MSAPETLEAQLVWDLTIRCSSQMKVLPMGGVMGFDLPALMIAADSAGVDRTLVIDLLPMIEAGMAEAFEKQRG